MNIQAIEHLKNVDSRLAKVIDHVGNNLNMEYNSSIDSFFFLVKEIVGQMLSSTVKKIIVSRLVVLCENVLTPEKVSELNIAQLRNIGLSKSKANYIINLANLVKSREITFEKFYNLTDDEIIAELTKIRGIGNWTAKMYLIFYLQRENVLPYEDAAFLQAYKWLYNTKLTSPKSISRRCKRWQPYTSIGAKYLYIALDSGLTKVPIGDFLNG